MANSTEVSSVDRLLDHVRQARPLKNLGWRAFDSEGIGINATDLVIIAGRTGHGKSAVLINLLLNWLNNYPDESYIFVSLEMPGDAILLRTLSSLTRRLGGRGCSYYEVRNYLQGKGKGKGKTDSKVADEIAQAIVKARDYEDRLLLVYDPEMTLDNLHHLIETAASRMPNLGGIFVDYLQLLRLPPEKSRSEEMRTTEISQSLKRIASSRGCPVVTAAQISGEAARLADLVPEGRFGDERVMKSIAKRRPQLHHLQHSSGEQEADLVMGILNYRADYQTAIEESGIEDQSFTVSAGSGPFDLSIMKNRFGQLGLAQVVFESRSGSIRDPGVMER